MATVIAYVDGFNLYHGLHDKYRRRYGLAGEQSVGLTPQTPRSPSWRASETDGLFRDDSYLWLDLEHLVQPLRPNDHIVAVRYFTALVRDEPAALARQTAGHLAAKLDLAITAM